MTKDSGPWTAHLSAPCQGRDSVPPGPDMSAGSWSHLTKCVIVPEVWIFLGKVIQVAVVLFFVFF